MRVLHLELGFPEQLEDLGGDPVLYASCVCLLGVLVLHIVLTTVVFPIMYSLNFCVLNTIA